MKKNNNQVRFSFFLLLFFLLCSLQALEAGLTVQGTRGFFNVPSHRTVRPKEIELSVKQRWYKHHTAQTEGSLTNLGFAFSPIQDFELFTSFAIDSKNSLPEQDPLLGFKVRLPSVGEGELAELAFGVIFDTNPNNYHSAYLTLGGFGLAYNFGGNSFTGTSNFGRYDKDKKQPKSLSLIMGIELPERRIGQRGYMTQYFVDYNGDVATLGVRFASHRGFSVEAAASTKTSYKDFYDYKPLSIGIGANF